MISIIISSFRPHYFRNLESNIKDTIGCVDYEIIKIHNPDLMNINAAYNTGAKMANYDILLFLHEDLSFISDNWGLELTSLMSNEEIGLVGIAGNEKKFKMPTGCETGISKFRHVYVTHSSKEQLNGKRDLDPIEVKTLDGVFLGIRKIIWDRIPFNENIKGFHFYDLDYSLRVGEHFRNFVLPAIRIRHFSKGNFGDDWIRSNLRFHKYSYNFDVPTKTEKKIVRVFWYNRLIQEKISRKLRFRYILNMGFGKYTWKFALRFLLKKQRINSLNGK